MALALSPYWRIFWRAIRLRAADVKGGIMKTMLCIRLASIVLVDYGSAYGQHTKPVYVSMPSAGNLQHLPLAAAKFKGFYNEMGITNAQLVFLRGNSINVQALVGGSV